MKKKILSIKNSVITTFVFLLLFIACYQFDFVNQPNSADPNSFFEVQISATTTDGDGGIYIPYFGIMLPVSWTVNDSIEFTMDTITGFFVYSDSLAQEMNVLDPPPTGYYWWVSEGANPVIYNYGDTYVLSPVINTDSQTGTFYLDYMLGSNSGSYGGINNERSNGHLITVGLPDNIVVTNTNDTGPGSLRAAISSIDFNGTIIFDLSEGDTIILKDQLLLVKDLTINGPDEYSLVISGNLSTRVFYIAENRSPHLSDLHIVNGDASNGGGFYCDIGSNPTLNNVIIKNNKADDGSGIYCNQSNPILQNVIISNNAAENKGGGIYYNASTLKMSEVTICNNTAYEGGGIYASSNSNVVFDTINRCDIFLNNALFGSDICSFMDMEVVVDTFTVLSPTEFHTYPIENFSFDILNGKVELVNADLYVSPDGNNENNGLTPDDPLKTIHFAYLKMNPNPFINHTIFLLEGTYSSSVNGEIFPIFSRDFINLSGVSQNDVILDAEGQSNVLYCSSNSNSIIENLSLTGGSASIGGGINCANSNPLFKNLVITNNVAEGIGGGISFYNSNPILQNVSINSNTALNSGGGIYLEHSSPTLQDVSIDGNTALNAGGGIYVSSFYYTILNLQNTNITNNHSETGGGIYCDYGAQLVFDTLNRCNIYLNSSSSGNDIYSECYLNVVVDTFTVLLPNEYHVYPFENFDFDILHGKLEQVDADLYVSPDGDNSNSGLTSGDPLKNIRFAFSKILVGVQHPNTIHLMEGTYGPSANEEIFPLDMIDYISLSGVSESGVILDAEGLSRVIEFNDDNNITVSDMTILNGFSDSDGGGVYCYISSPELENMTIANNTSYKGSGIYLDNSNPELENITLTNNNSTNGSGIFLNYSSPLLTDVTMEDNLATSDGGGIYCDNHSHPFLSNVKIANNTSEDQGGGIYCDYYSNPVFDSLNRCNIYLNSAVSGSDLYAENYMEVIVDTFTVLYPKYFHATPLINFSFDILHGLIPQVNADLFVSPEGDDSNSGLTGDDPLKTIQYALSVIAEDSLNLYTINLLEGIYGPSTNGESFPIYLVDYVSLSGSPDGEVILDAEGLSNVIEINSATHSGISDLTITNGYNVGEGGGIYCYNSNPILENIILTNNHAADGGGIFCSNSSPEIQNVTLLSNTADNNGGGVNCYYDSNPIFENTHIEGNVAINGGGIYCRYSSPSFDQVSITGNFAEIGGGMLCGYDSSPYLKDVILTDNVANSNGGGLYCDSYSSPGLRSVKILNNASGNNGGGIFCESNAATVFDSLNRCDIYLNTSPSGSDLYSDAFMEVIVDTFTVSYPKYYYAFPLENFSFDILHGLIPQVNADLYVSPDGNNSNTGLTLDDPLKNIQHAINIIAEDSVNLYTIHLLNGIYSPSSNEESFPLRFPEYVNISGVSENDVVIDAQGQARVIEFYNSGDVVVSELTITGGYSNASGGGIYFVNSDPEITNVTITNNSVGSHGGGFYCKNSDPNFMDVTIADNYAGFGGGFSCDDNSQPLIQHVNVTNNTAQYSGGGIYVRVNSDLYLTNSILTDNFANISGGGIYCGNSSNLFIDSVLIVNNEALENGGGICIAYSDMALGNVEISFNSAGNKGGGFYTNHANAKLLNILVKNNYAKTGGGIYNTFLEHEYMNVIVSGNTAATEGGGILFNYATSDLSNATITSNYADKGGGIYCKSSDLILWNSILWNEAVDEIYFKEQYGSSNVTVSYTDIQGGEEGIITNGNGTANWLDGNIEAYPLFAGMGDHPYELTASSPCIDAGTPDTTGFSLPFTDLLGNYRIWDGDGDGVAIIDMGAYEFGAIPVGTEKTEVPNLSIELRTYPNPFSDKTMIEYSLSQSSLVILEIFDLNGQLISTLLNEFQMAGRYEALLNGAALPPGIYFCVLKTNLAHAGQTVKMIKL